ncbi:hypothetical protein [Kribbella sp. NPDC051770]|uniref:hypothetical protein n=1 Tax=Kribbella sp. NPDC051770 TaxID=3155413 RepID=UPI0034375ADA
MGKSSSRATSALLAVLAGITAGVVAVLLTAVVILATEPSGSVRPGVQAAGVPSPAAPKPAPQTPRPSSTAASVKAFGDVRELPVGLVCRDLKQRGYGYAAAVEYWQVQAQPNRMDADRNGIPCEPEYTRTEVGKYWQGRKVSSLASVPDGLLCRDLAARGASYGEAVTYWWYAGMPARLDADGNGIPCEQVYPATVVQAFWRQ